MTASLTTDLVTRLRRPCNGDQIWTGPTGLFSAAANEIEQLRGLLKLANQGHYQAIEIRTYLHGIGEEPT